MTHILLTRSSDKSEQLAQELAAMDVKTSIQPLLTLESVDVSEQQLGTLDNADIVIFVSQDAVKYLKQVRPSLPEHAVCFAVGKATAQTVIEHFEKPCQSPIVETSEGLLAIPELNNVETKNIVLVKGRGGRTKIAKELKSKGAILQPLSVYQRLTNKDVTHDVVKSWQQSQVTAVLLTSNASVDAFFSRIDDVTWCAALTLYVVSERSADYVKQNKPKVHRIVNCQGADNQSIVEAIIASQQVKQGNAMEKEKDITLESEIKDKPSKKQNTTLPADRQTRSSGKGIAFVALVVSLASVGALGYGYTLFLKQQNTLQALQQETQSLRQNASRLAPRFDRVDNEIIKVKQTVSDQLSQAEAALNTQINTQLATIKQIKPELNSEEVQSLYRMAEFKAYVQQDYIGAASMLSRLDTLLQNFSGTQQVRTVLHQDIQALQAIKPLDIEGMYLKLDGLTANLNNLPLNMVVLPEVVDQADAEKLSNNVDDWQQNLKRSWHLLVDDFIKIRKRSEAIEPLLSQEEQNLIRHQLRFYLVQAQTALMEQQATIYTQALAKANEIISRYYDQNDNAVIYLQQQLQTLQSTELDFKPEFTFQSAQAIKELI